MGRKAKKQQVRARPQTIVLLTYLNPGRCSPGTFTKKRLLLGLGYMVLMLTFTAPFEIV